MFSHGGTHSEFFVTSVVLPFLFVVIMNAIEGLVDKTTWRNRLIKISWDNCVLAIGVLAGIFANSDVVKAYGGSIPVIAASFGVVISLGTAIGIAYIRQSIVKAQEDAVANAIRDAAATARIAPTGKISYRIPYPNVEGWKVIVCLALSGASLGLPGYVAFRY